MQSAERATDIAAAEANGCQYDSANCWRSGDAVGRLWCDADEMRRYNADKLRCFSMLAMLPMTPQW